MTVAEPGDGTHQARSTPAARPAPARPPAAPLAAGYLGALCAVGLTAAGAVLIRDGIAAAGWIGGGRWTHTALRLLDGEGFHAWMIPVGASSALVGLCCVYAAVKPRSTRAVALSAHTSVYLDVSDIARAAAGTARAVPGVTNATARARRRTITVRAQTTGADPVAQRAAIAEAVVGALGPLAKMPKIRVRSITAPRR
jgi:hypothetical protein